MPSSPLPVAVIGAGPYGVSIAAHLQHAGVRCRIFGRPMYRWRNQMPIGMLLKSEGKASSLSDPTGSYTLARYCRERNLPFQPVGLPVSLDHFTQYALWFQHHVTRDVEETQVTHVDGARGEFELCLSNGSSLRARRIVVATGLQNTAHIPRALADLPSELRSHSEDHRDVGRFQGKRVIVIGGGQSALEMAALLAEADTEVRIAVRKPTIIWNQLPHARPRPLYLRLRHPSSGLGEGLGLWFYATAPNLYRYLPQRTRFDRVRRELGPAGAWWLKERILGRIPVLTGHTVLSAERNSGRAVLRMVGPDLKISEVSADHIICATGYRFAPASLAFLSKRLISTIRTVEQQPVLSAAFESTAPGVYITGLASASCFGPAMRFLHGASFTARRLTQHIAGDSRRYDESRIDHAVRADTATVKLPVLK